MSDHCDHGKADSTKQHGTCCHGTPAANGPETPQQESSCCSHGDQGEAGAGTAPGTYICACCPGVESETPAHCPHCGMALQRVGGAATTTQYTCPMHPEIIRDAPGACPICGMALEPMKPTDGPNHELIDFTRRMWISVAAAVPLIVLTMGPMVGLPVRDWLGHQTAGYLEFALATPVVLWAALPFFKRGWASVVNRSSNMWTLISLGVAAA